MYSSVFQRSVFKIFAPSELLPKMQAQTHWEIKIQCSGDCDAYSPMTIPDYSICAVSESEMLYPTFTALAGIRIRRRIRIRQRRIRRIRIPGQDYLVGY